MLKTYFKASWFMRPKALMAASLISTTSHLKSGTISLYKAKDNPLALLSLRSGFIESGDELKGEKKFYFIAKKSFFLHFWL